MEAYGMAEQQGRPGGQGEDGEGGGADGERPEDHGDGEHGAIPQGVDRVPDDAALDRAAAGGLDEAVDRAGIVVGDGHDSRPT